MTGLSAAAAWRSPDLGERLTVATTAGPISAFQRGEGSSVVFVHGWLANANLWRKLVAELAPGHRCVTLDLPLGSHTAGMPPGADLSPEGMGRVIAGALDSLGLDAAILVGNDSGGAYSQMAVAHDPRCVAGLVLNACETPYDPFPPTAFAGLQAAARSPGALRTLIEALRDPELRMAPQAYGGLAKRPLDRAAGDSYVLPILDDDRVLADAEAAFGSASQAAVAAAGEVLKRAFAGPVCFAWPAEDEFFPLASARRFAGELADGAVSVIEDSRAFTPEDNPQALARVIAAVAAQARAPA